MYTSLQVLLRYVRVKSGAGKESRNYNSDTYARVERKAEDARDAARVHVHARVHVQNDEVNVRVREVEYRSAYQFFFWCVDAGTEGVLES
jgi:hypothetical protein